MKLLLLTRSLHIGGAELVLANLCEYIDRDLFDVEVCCLKEKGNVAEGLGRSGFDIHEISGSQSGWAFLSQTFKLRRLVKDRGTTLIHSHGTAALAGGAQCKLLEPGIRLIHTFHFGNYPWARKGNLRLERLFKSVPDQLVAVGVRQKEMIQSTYGLLDRDIVTIHNGVAARPENIDRELLRPFLDSGRIVIGSISTLIEQKGLTHLLDTAAALKKKSDNFLFLVVGDGYLRDQLERRCKELGLHDTVFFLGWVRDAASRILPAFDIFFQPSLWEAMSMVVLEAMAAGKPVVATAVGDNPIVVSHGVNGFLVAPREVEGMVEHLDALIRDADLRVAFGAEALKEYSRKYTVESMTRRYERLYLDVIRPDWTPGSASGNLFSTEV